MSDGDLSPAELVREAKELGLSGVALTDHDTIDGIKEAAAEAKKLGIELVPGVEIGCYDEEKGFRDIHVLGLFIDPEDETLKNIMNKMKEERVNSKKKIISKLNDLGYKITYEEVQKKVKGEIGRPHVAKTLIEKYPDKFSSIREVFETLIGRGKIAYVDHEFKLGVKECIDAIKSAGGIAILAHPGAYEKETALLIIELFVSQGIDGLEVFYPYDKNYANISKERSDTLNTLFLDFAKQNNLLLSGGSDYHGKSKSSLLGEAQVEDNILEKMKVFLNKD